MHTRFGQLTGHHSGDGVCERDNYILEKLQFCEMHIAGMPSRQTCSVSIKFKCQYNYHFSSNSCVCHNSNFAFHFLKNKYAIVIYWCFNLVLCYFSLIPNSRCRLMQVSQPCSTCRALLDVLASVSAHA